MKKTIISIMTSMVVLSMLIMTPVKALENAIAFTSQNDQILVTLNVKDTNKEVLTMKASFQIKAQDENMTKENIQFHFNQDIQSVVKEYRYDTRRHILTIYISGQENLFANKQLKLGTIDLNVSKDKKVDISLVKDSIEYVSSAYTKDTLVSDEVSIEWGNVAEDPSIPESTPSDDLEDNQQDNQDTTQDSQKPSVGVTEDSNKDTIEKTNQVQNSSSQMNTGDSTNMMVYAWMAVGSLIVGLYLFKRKMKRHN